MTRTAQAGVAAAAALAAALALGFPPRVPPLVVTVEATASASGVMEVFAGDFRGAPERAALAAGEAAAARFVLPGDTPRLRLDPLDVAGATVDIRRVTLAIGDRPPVELEGRLLAGWACDGAGVEAVETAAVVRASSADPMCVSPALDRYLDRRAWRESGVVRALRWLSWAASAVALAVFVLLTAPRAMRAAGLGAAAFASPARVFRWLAALSLLYVASAAMSIAWGRHLFADGAFQLTGVMAVEWFAVSPGRWGAAVAGQWPVVAAIRLFNVRDVDVLIWLYGAGLALPPLAGVWLSWAVCRRVEPRLVWFPATATFAIMAAWRFYPANELHLAMALFWPFFTAALAWPPGRPPGWMAVVLGAGLAALWFRSHDGILFVAPILVAVIAVRARRVTGVRLRLALVALAAFGAWAAWHYLSMNLGNMRVVGTNFFRGLTDLPQNGLFRVAAATLAAVVAGLAAPPGWSRLRRAGLGAVAAVGLATVTEVLMHPDRLRPWTHQSTRAAAPMLTAAFAALAAVIWWRPRWDAIDWRWLARLTATAALVVVAWEAVATARWAAFRGVMRAELTRDLGLVEVGRTALAADAGPLRQMVLGWELPALSVLWARRGDVTTIVYSAEAQPVGRLYDRATLLGFTRYDRRVPPELVR